MGTLHADTVARVVDRESERDPEFARVTEKLRNLMERGYYPPSHLTKFVQRYEGQRTFDAYEAYAFGQCHSLCLTGEVLYAAIVVGVEPGRDADADGHRAILDDLPHPFRGKFWGQKEDSDGLIEWDAPIQMHRCFATPWRPGEQAVDLVEVEPGFVPLEIGTTQGSRSLHHLRFDGGLARWPYGSKTIWVFKTLHPHRREGSPHAAKA